MITNAEISDNFSLLSKLMDIHRENEFKAKAYASAAYAIDKLPIELSEVSPEKFATYKGIGNSAAEKIRELFQFGEIKRLKQLLEITPQGVMEMLSVKGIGPKKIAVIWHEMGIESLGELLYACEENRLVNVKGFGQKTQQTIREQIEFFFKHRDNYLYAELEDYARLLHDQLTTAFPEARIELTGAYRRKMETIEKLEWVATVPEEKLKAWLQETSVEVTESSAIMIGCKSREGVRLLFHLTEAASFGKKLFETSSSEAFLKAWGEVAAVADEAQLFEVRKMNYIPSFYREEWSTAPLPDFIETSSIKGIIHSHSNWSDGSNTIEEMAEACRKKGFEYLVISDHSKAAHYANGLQEDRIKAQHELIDSLNERWTDFKIFKSIECDILGEGQLDYSPQTLELFDLVIASVHSNLRMNEEKAMQRLLRAIENPFTTILGHLTGRLLLSRKGYAVDHERIIRACAENNVVLELNAHPRRLDIDWRYIKSALRQNVLISINPDAHAISGFDDIQYGVLVARKAGLTAQQNLSSFSLQEFEKYVRERKN
ncbi:MAG: DNA polymerase/3'-5' exonuclease PolX [Bacteroidetes bacterium]|nr:DNA polymerase/3'-5' exonuclease PolX [Bacteroidota bacterium]